MQPTDIGPVNALLKRRWGIVSALGPIVSIGSDVFPTERVDLAMDADLHYLADQRICGAGRIDAGVVGEQSSVGLQNPGGSGILAIVRGLFVSTETAQAVNLTLNGAGSPTFDASVNGAVRDSRPQNSGEGSLSVCIIGDRSTVAAGVGLQVGTFQSRNTVEDLTKMGPWVLGPDSRLTVNVDINNTDIRVSFTWIERVIGKWER